ncbi:MAG: hypothetical protein M3442_03980 [Chloroflexota bacterium]|nr:hypothetical protein [Chloroflexota bacterium]
MTSRTVEKITVVVAVGVLGVALAVNVRSPLVLLLVGALVVTVSAGLDLVLRGEARYRPTPDLFVLPAALAVGAVLFLQLLDTGVSIVAGLTAFGALLFAVFWAEHRLRGTPADPRLAVTVLSVVGYIAAFVLYAAIYQAKTRTLISAPAIVLITFLLGVRQFRLSLEGSEGKGIEGKSIESKGSEGQGVEGAAATAGTTVPATPWPRTLLYAASVALAVGEITWALNYWPLNGLFGGAFLLSTFYFLIGLLSHHLQRRLSRRLMAEYGVVVMVGTLLIAVAGLFRRVT